jgi:hypothetical protein
MTQDYYGTKRITAWQEDRDGPGYSVKYSDGYTSWSPRDVFEAAYQPLTALSFGHALVALKEGHRVARAGWNGKGMWLVLIAAGNACHSSRAGTFPMLDCIGMKTAQGDMLPGWLASQTDMLADDWQIVE